MAIINKNQDSKNMASYVTRHVQNPLSGNFKFLLSGIDTLDIGLYVAWDHTWESIVKYLYEKKEAAQNTNGLVDEIEDGRKFIHYPTGKKPNYRYHLEFQEYHLYFAVTAQFDNSPNVYVSLKAESIWHKGIRTLIELITTDLSYFGGKIEKIKISRCDVCVDFYIEDGLTEDFLKTYKVSRSVKTRVFKDNDILETYYDGSSKSPVQVRIYDKGKEVDKNSNKLWFLELWGIDNTKNVWRVEFQLRRVFLKQVGVNTIEDLESKLGGVWRYLTEEWFSLRIPDNDKAERRTVCPLWNEVRNCADRFGPSITIERNFISESQPSVTRYISYIAGCYVSIAALLSFIDLDEVHRFLGLEIRNYWKRKNFREELIKRTIKRNVNVCLEGSEYERKRK